MRHPHLPRDGDGMTALKRLTKALRSRKLAVWLIAIFIAYTAFATITAKGGDYGAPYSHPIFIAIAALLTLATAACAWERTAAAYRVWRRGGGASTGFVERLRDRPQIAVKLEGVAPVDELLESVSHELHRIGLRVRPGRDRVVASTGRLGLIGSPVFHWSLVLLFVFVGLGQLTRSEGLMGIPIGSSRLDAADAYGRVDEGPLHNPGFTGLTLRVPEIDLAYVVGGIDRGPSPVVEVYDGSELIERRRVYPNSPLRYRSLLIHSNNYGLAAKFVLESDGVPTSVEVLYDFKEGSASAGNVTPLALTRSGSIMEFESSVALEKVGRAWVWDIPKKPAIAWALAESGETTSGVLQLGESVDLGDGGALRLESVTHYARLSVVDDWSVTPIYILFVLAGIGLTLALLLPTKTVWVMLVETDEGRWLHARTRQPRGDRVFPGRVDEALSLAAAEEDDRS